MSSAADLAWREFKGDVSWLTETDLVWFWININ